MKNINPFVIGRYESEEYFCDREIETSRLKNSLDNQRNITLVSPRRIGKTGLIFHFFNQMEKEKDVAVFYIDLMDTQNLEQFIRTFAKAVIGKLDNKMIKLINVFSSVVKSIRPNITIDPNTGQPLLEVKLDSMVSPETTIREIFTYLKQQKKRIIIAFDEFQQIAAYPEKGTEALLRSQIQQINQTMFIYSGSSKHMLTSMFGDGRRPFYQSSEFLSLGKINQETYAQFIIEKFEKTKRKIDVLTAHQILNLTQNYTWYVQYLCNKLWGSGAKIIDHEMVLQTLLNILKEQEVVFYNYRNLLTDLQFDFLKAIAKEGTVKMPTSKDFIQKHGLSAPSTIKTSLDSLIGKEMILSVETGYRVYDVFFSEWLKRN